MKKIIAFDFDGTLFDTGNEQFETSCETAEQLGYEVKDRAHLRKKFFEGRPLLLLGEEFPLLVAMALENPKIDFSKKTYNDILREKKKIGRKKMRLFHDIFYKNRKKLRKNSPKKWHSLNKPFGAGVRAVKAFSGDFEIAVATTKDISAAWDLIKKAGLSGYIKRKNIYSKEVSKEKMAQLEKIAKDNGVSLKHIVLVEDSLIQAQKAVRKGIKTCIVDWGHNTKKQLKEAKSKGIVVASGKNAVDKIRFLTI